MCSPVRRAPHRNVSLVSVPKELQHVSLFCSQLVASGRTAIRSLARKRRPVIGRRQARSAPGLEALEARMVLSTLTVTSAADDGSSGTLRSLIGAASPGSTIVFDHRLVGQTITLKSGALELTKNLDIEGPGASQLTISGNSASRVFDVSSGATVTIAGLTIANGEAVTGGGIDNAGNLVLNHSTLSNNQAVGGLGGGGILNEAGADLTLNHSAADQQHGDRRLRHGRCLRRRPAERGQCHRHLLHSSAATRPWAAAARSFFGGSVGGGIDNFGGASLTVTASTFDDNQALGAGAGNFGIGGAIENNAGLDVAHPSTATINNSVFVGNMAGGGAGVAGNGGAIDNEGPGATMTLSNSTLLDNQSAGGEGGFGVGGAIMNYADSTCTIRNSTLIGNVARGGPESTNNGGGIDNQTATMYLIGSTLIGNQALGGAGGDGTSINTSGEGVGGGIINVFGATLTVVNSTLAGNQAIGGDGGTAASAYPLTGGALGGGIANASGSTLSISQQHAHRQRGPRRFHQRRARWHRPGGRHRKQPIRDADGDRQRSRRQPGPRRHRGQRLRRRVRQRRRPRQFQKLDRRGHRLGLQPERGPGR